MNDNLLKDYTWLLGLISPTIGFAILIMALNMVGLGGFALGKIPVYSIMASWLILQIFLIINGLKNELTNKDTQKEFTNE